MPKPCVKLSKVRVEGGGVGVGAIGHPSCFGSPSFHASSRRCCAAHLLLSHPSSSLFFFVSSPRFSNSSTLCFHSLSFCLSSHPSASNRLPVSSSPASLFAPSPAATCLWFLFLPPSVRLFLCLSRSVAARSERSFPAV